MTGLLDMHKVARPQVQKKVIEQAFAAFMLSAQTASYPLFAPATPQKMPFTCHKPSLVEEMYSRRSQHLP
jgi:hypothetical protein